MSAPVWFLWHGGHSYAVPSVPGDLETAETVADVLNTLADRHHNRDGRTPAVDETAGAHIFHADPSDSDDPYPDQLAEWSPGEGCYVLAPA